MSAYPKELPTDKQVREKLVHQGSGTLSDAELLSILLKEGTADRSALELATDLYDSFGRNLVEMGSSSLDALRKTENLGTPRAAMIAAALELGRRYGVSQSAVQETIMTDKDVVKIFHPQLAHLAYEEFWAIYLGSSNRILDKIRISQGGTAATVVDHKLIVKRALEKLAQGIIMVHNHPSGNPEPSEQDKQLTEKVSRAASLFDITMADHVIITITGSYSFRNHGFFDSIPDEQPPVGTAPFRWQEPDR